MSTHILYLRVHRSQKLLLVFKFTCTNKNGNFVKETYTSGYIVVEQFIHYTQINSGGRLLVNCVPMREQRTAKLTLNSVFNILKLIPLFTVSSKKVTLSYVIDLNAYSLTSATFCKICKNIPFSYKNSIFPTLNDDSAAHCPARKKYPFSSFFFFVHASVHN